MKKILITILGILGICISFCNAQSCTVDVTPSGGDYSHSSPWAFPIELKTQGIYSFSSITFKGYTAVSSLSTLNVCYGNSSVSSISDIYNNYTCLYNISYTAQFVYDSNFNTNTRLNFFNSLDFTYNDGKFIYFILEGSGFPLIVAHYDIGVSFDFDNYVSYVVNFEDYYLKPVNICYSYDTGITPPKFKVNYGNTSYEYELDSDLSIYLKSPVVQNGNTFTYAGSTGLNLFYNGSSQFYSKDKLYLNSMYRYNNNIFTPICS